MNNSKIKSISVAINKPIATIQNHNPKKYIVGNDLKNLAKNQQSRLYKAKKAKQF